MEISGLLNLQGEMFLLLAAGAMIRKKGILPPAAKDILTDLILYLVLPCNIIHSFRMEFDLGVIKTVLVLIVAAVMIQVLCMVLIRILYNREETGRKKVFQYATLVSNAGFMGNPNAEGVFGAQGLIYASIYLVPQRIVMWTAGIACFTESGSPQEVVKKVAAHPCIVSVYIGLALMIGQLQLPDFLGMTNPAHRHQESGAAHCELHGNPCFRKSERRIPAFRLQNNRTSAYCPCSRVIRNS